MIIFRKLLISSGLALLIASCASNMESELRKIQVGDDKSKVLELVGDPRRSVRIKDKDRWIYTYQKDGHEQSERIDFKNGKVIRGAEKSGKDDEDVTPENAETYEAYEKSVLKKRRKK